MADWKTHLYCAHKVNETLMWEGRDLDLFLYGNLFPDINMGWLIQPQVCLEQAETHFDAIGQEYFWAPLRFYEKYQKEILAKSPLHLGYLFHLWMDVAVMTDFVSRVPMSEMISKYHEVRQKKWKDMALFIKDYSVRISSENIAEIVTQAKTIEEVQIVESDLLQVPACIENASSEVEEGYEYSIYTAEELSAFYEKNCKDFVAWVKELR